MDANANVSQEDNDGEASLSDDDFDEDSRAAKLRLLHFLSLFRDLQKPTRFGGGGG